jgi:hypothetical protein
MFYFYGSPQIWWNVPVDAPFPLEVIHIRSALKDNRVF